VQNHRVLIEYKHNCKRVGEMWQQRRCAFEGVAHVKKVEQDVIEGAQ